MECASCFLIQHLYHLLYEFCFIAVKTIERGQEGEKTHLFAEKASGRPQNLNTYLPAEFMIKVKVQPNYNIFLFFKRKYLDFFSERGQYIEEIKYE